MNNLTDIARREIQQRLNAIAGASSIKLAHIDLTMACMRFPDMIMTEEEVSTYERTHFLTNNQCERLLKIFEANNFNVSGLKEKLLKKEE